MYNHEKTLSVLGALKECARQLDDLEMPGARYTLGEAIRLIQDDQRMHIRIAVKALIHEGRNIEAIKLYRQAYNIPLMEAKWLVDHLRTMEGLDK